MLAGQTRRGVLTIMPSEAVVKFFEELAASFGTTMGQLTGAEVKHQAELKDDSSAPELWANAALHGDPSCRLGIGFDQRAGLLLARAMISEPPSNDTSLTAEDQELLVEFWKQALGRTSTDLKPLLGEFAFDYLDGQAPEWQKAITGSVTFESAKGKIPLVLCLSLEMVRRLAEKDQPADSIAEPAKAVAGFANNLDLLLEVPLAVTLRFGQRRMPLREILQLSSGSVIELDRQAEDAVDLLLDERLIARGQVVVVDGCYGLRVTEVCR